MIRPITLCFLLLFTAVANAWETPREAVDEFLKFELDGGRLQSWPFDKYLDVVAEYDEPGWDSVHVIRKAEVVEFGCSSERCTARVRFDFEPTSTFTSERALPHPDGGSETVEFGVTHSGNEWRLESSGDYPRVKLDALIARGLATPDSSRIGADND